MNHIASLSFNVDLKLITLRGTLSFATCMNIFNQSLPIIHQLQPNVEIDFSQINCLDSSILALLVEWYKYMQSNQQQLRILNLPEHIQSLLKITELDQVLKELFSPC